MKKPNRKGQRILTGDFSEPSARQDRGAMPPVRKRTPTNVGDNFATRSPVRKPVRKKRISANNA